MTDDTKEAPFDSTAPTPEDMAVSIRRLVRAWETDWKIIVTGVVEQTGLTVEQVIMWEMMMSWNDMIRHQRAHMRWMRGWLEQHGEDGEEWRE